MERERVSENAQRAKAVCAHDTVIDRSMMTGKRLGEIDRRRWPVVNRCARPRSSVMCSFRGRAV